MNKIVKTLSLAIFLIICLLLTQNKVFGAATIADSGFDSSYDSGGGSWSSSSSSSYDSWSSSDSSYSSSDGYSSSPMSNLELAIFIIFMIAIIVIPLITSTRKYKPYVPVEKPVNEKEIVEKIKQYIPDFDKEKFLNDCYNIYLEVQNAWMYFKLDDVKGKITDELFNMYQSQLDTLEVKGEQNVMSDFKLNRAYLKDVSVQNDNIAIKTGFVVEFYDYIIEQSSGKVLRGSKNFKLRITYEMNFRKTLNQNRVVEKCPNCGNNIKHMNGYGICEYCRTKIVTENSEWVLTDKKSINQIRL